MRNSFSRISSILLFLAIVVTSTPASAEVIDRVVARVNNEIVTLHDVRQSAVPYMLQNGLDPDSLEDPKVRRDLYEKVLDDLINRRLIVAEADELDLKVSDKELEQWLAFTRQQQGMSEEQFKQVIARYGMEYDIYRDMVRENLLKIRLVKTKVASQFTISEEEVDAEYRKRFGEAVGEEPVIEVAHILLRPADESAEALADARKRAEAAKARVEKGEEFATVAEEMSDGPTAAKGGALGTFGKGDLDPEFEDAAFDLEPGVVSNVVQTKFGYHVILVSERKMRVSNNVQSRRDRIQAELQQQTMERLLAEYTDQLRNRAFVEVNY